LIFEFNDLKLDAELLEMTNSAGLVVVEPQVFSLLVYLIENRDRVVSKDDLISAVWQGRIVSDATLNTRINAARRAVGDSGKAQEVIRTYSRRGFRFVADVQADTLKQAPAQPDHTIDMSLPAKPSIAVLPFANMSNDPDQAYFADGITEDVIRALSRMRWLFVISRNSSFAYKDRTVSLATVSQELGVRYILEGSVRKAGQRLRITGELIDATSGHQIWADKYDGDLEDVFSLQDDITASISTTLISEITMAEITRVQKKHPASYNAWDHLMRALPLLHQLNASANDAAKAALQEAIKIDPDFVAPHVKLAWSYALEALHGWHKRGSSSLDQVDFHAQAAIKLNPNDPGGHCALALAHFWHGHQEEAIEAALRAIALESNLPDAHGILGSALAVSGKPDQAIESLERALRGSPRDPIRWFWYHGLANAHFAAQNYDEAIKWANLATDLSPGWAFSHLIAAASAALSKRPAKAAQEMTKLLQLIPQYSLKRYRRNPIWQHPPDIARLEEGLKAAGLPE